MTGPRPNPSQNGTSARPGAMGLSRVPGSREYQPQTNGCPGRYKDRRLMSNVAGSSPGPVAKSTVTVPVVSPLDALPVQLQRLFLEPDVNRRRTTRSDPG